jgi:hypothetical protein
LHNRRTNGFIQVFAKDQILNCHSWALSPEILTKQGILLFSHPPYSPDLVQADFISKMKNFDGREDIRDCFVDPAEVEAATGGRFFSWASDSLCERGMRLLVCFYDLSLGTKLSLCGKYFKFNAKHLMQNTKFLYKT